MLNLLFPRSHPAVLKFSSTVVDDLASIDGTAPLNNRTCLQTKIHKPQIFLEAYRGWVALKFVLLDLQTHSSELSVLLRRDCITGISPKQDSSRLSEITPETTLFFIYLTRIDKIYYVWTRFPT